MSSLIYSLAITLLLCHPLTPHASDKLEAVHVGDVTVQYPAGLEKQAKELARTADRWSWTRCTGMRSRPIGN